MDKWVGIRAVHYPDYRQSLQSFSRPRSSFRPAQGERNCGLTAIQPYFSRHQRSPCFYIPLRNRYQNLRNPHADNGRDRNARKERESIDVGTRARSAKVGERRDGRHGLSVSLSFRCFLPSCPVRGSLLFNCSRMLNCIVFPFFVFEPLGQEELIKSEIGRSPSVPGGK